MHDVKSPLAYRPKDHASRTELKRVIRPGGMRSRGGLKELELNTKGILRDDRSLPRAGVPKTSSQWH